MEFFATCPSGFEKILADELERLNVPRVRPLKGQVAFEGELRDAYVACLWSHLASRVIAVLGRGDATSSDALYETVYALPWEEHFGVSVSFAVDASGTNDQLRSTQFVGQRAKDAISDRLTHLAGARPSVNAQNPDVSIVVRISRNRATVGIDLAGAPLFRRGYDRSANQHNLRPDYAAALLELGGWRAFCDRATNTHNSADADKVADLPTLLDLSSRSSTLPVEAGLMAAHRAPGLLRLRWGFQSWLKHEPATWETLVEEARAQALDHVPATLLVLSRSKTSSAVRGALRAAGLEPSVRALSDDALEGVSHPALLACDLSQLRDDDLVREANLLNDLARIASQTAPHHSVVAGRDKLAGTYLVQEATAQVQTALGRDPLYLEAFGTHDSSSSLPDVSLSAEKRIPVLVAASDQFAARLAKVCKQRAKWALRSDVTCYRVYDADLPDYAVAIDLYQGTDPATGTTNGMRWLQIAEYAAPKGIDATLARARLMDVLAIAPSLLDVSPHRTFLRIRRRDKGGSQYANEAKKDALKPRTNGRSKAETPLPPGSHLIDEGGLTFEVNFSSRLDCGIFLDHRETRAMLREMAKQTAGSKRFLNLFAYTGTATCYAADGGMRYTTTVDLSRPSLDWARRNMERNGFDGKEHEYVQADVVRWVGEQRHTRNRWDLVFCDVPTFSNSNRMGRRSFDVQRDHAELLIGVSRLLVRGGTCVFSCNLRSFKPDVDKLAKAGVTIEDITAQTIPEDFARNPKIHHTYLVRRP